MFSIYFTFRWIVFHCNVVVLSSFRYFWWISLFNLLHSYTNRIDWSGQILDWMGDPSKEPLSRSSHWQIPHSVHLLWGLAGTRALQRLCIFQNWCSGQSPQISGQCCCRGYWCCRHGSPAPRRHGHPALCSPVRGMQVLQEPQNQPLPEDQVRRGSALNPCYTVHVPHQNMRNMTHWTHFLRRHFKVLLQSFFEERHAD